MPKIKHLPTHEAQKIAAGQVIERPADIIKELIENSIDAGATTISLYVEDAGKQLIRVVDNGCGMDADDAHLCFEKHATSKICSMDELQNISTFGFRGEAMPSIAAVCKVTLITKQHDAPEGLMLTVQDSVIQSSEPISASTGTDISASDLFYNVPVRKKFLKKHDTELRHITHLFQAFCLDYPLIHFKLFSDNKQTLNCPPMHNIVDRYAQLWQNISSQQMLTVTAESASDSISIAGAISDHQSFRFDRSGIFLFVNNRWIKDFKLSNALIKGYMSVAPQGRYPMGCLAITIDPQLVDVNVHPRKEEVRFLHPRKVEQLIQATVKVRLEENIAKHIPAIKSTFNFAQNPMRNPYNPPMAHVSAMHNQKPYQPFNFDTVFPEPHAWDKSDTITPQAPIQEVALIPTPIVFAAEAKETIQTNISHDVTLSTGQPYTLIGQYRTTYILIEQEEGLFIVDQHAAHERILYELFAQRFTEVATVELLFPLLVSLSQDDIQLIEPYLPLFVENGINIELFGVNQLKIRATPVHLKDVSLDDMVKQTIGWINEYKYLDEQQFTKKLHEKIRAQMACKAAVKAGDVLSHAHMQQLLDTLHKTENRLTCPHGRPTGWLLSLHDIEKKFKRKL